MWQRGSFERKAANTQMAAAILEARYAFHVQNFLLTFPTLVVTLFLEKHDCFAFKTRNIFFFKNGLVQVVNEVWDGKWVI